MQKPAISIYSALLISVCVSLVLYSTILLLFRHQKEGIIKAAMPTSFAAKMVPGQDENVYNSVIEEIEGTDGIVATEFVYSIPDWTGDPQRQEQWQDLWKAYLSPIAYATSEYSIQNIDSVENIANQLQGISGISSLVWDNQGFHQKQELLQKIESQEHYLRILFYIAMVCLLAGLLMSYPIPLRRDYIMRTGMGGAGSQLSPERMLVQLVIFHVLLAIGLYSLLFLLVYALFPYPLQASGDPGVGSLLLSGNIGVSISMIIVTSIGWWFDTETMHDSGGISTSNWKTQ